MTVVDSHLHLWDLSTGDYGWNTEAQGAVHASFDAAQAAGVLAGARVDRAVLVQAADTDRDTEAMLTVARENAWVAGVVAWVPLEDPDGARARFEAWRERGEPVVGFRQLVHDDPRPDLLDRPEVRRTLREAGRIGLPFDVPDAWPRLWPALTRLVDALPELVVVVDHLGKPEFHETQRGGDADDDARDAWHRDLRELALRPNVVAKLSGLGGLLPAGRGARDPAAPPRHLLPEVELAVDAFGPDRLLFGGDWPVSLAHASYAETVATVRESLVALTPDERAAVFGGTASRVYRLGDGSDAGRPAITRASDGASSPRR